MEIEAKFNVPDAATLERLGELGELAGYELAGREVADMTDVYLDTDDRALQAAGLVCRRRDRGDRVVITVKRRGDAPASGGAAGGDETSAIHRRDEWETVVPGALAPIAAPASWPAGEARERVLAAAHERPLKALVEVRQSRVMRNLTREGRIIAELSLDTLTIVTPGGPLTPQHEVEVELKGDGTEADLAQIAALLQGDFALEPQPLSKFERAMAALATEPSAGSLLSADEEHLLARIARRTDAVGRRARVLLALHEGALQRDAAARADMAPRTVRYWLNRFRHEGLAIFPKRLVASASRRSVQAASAAGGAAAGGAAAMTRAAKKSRAKAKRDRKTPPSPMAAVVAAARTIPAGAAKTPAAGAAAAPAAQPAPAGRPGAHAKRQARPGIRATDTMAEAAFKTLRFHLERMLDHESGTRKGDDPEDLHDMRVATRRMRAALRVFGPYLDADTMHPVERGLRRTGRVLGAVRDLDVFHEKTVHYLDSLPDVRRNDLDPLLAVWQERREHARAAMIEYLDSGRYPRFVEAFTELLDDPGRASLAFVSDD
ncbi:MAG: CHAD domain-containing protein, partial [Thermoleophilia bacterium]